MGDILREMGRFAGAAPAYSEALTIYHDHEDTQLLDLANAVRGLALLKEDLGEKAEAKALWEEAGILYAEVKVEAGVKESARRAALL